MGRVITINYKDSFNMNGQKTIESIRTMKVNKEDIDIKTTVSLEHEGTNYSKYKIQFLKKTNVDAMYDNRPISYIFKKYNTFAYVTNDYDYVITVGNVRGVISRQSFDKLSKNTDIKCKHVKVDLVGAIESLIRSNSNITIDSGWFSNLGTNLSNAWLQGRKVNDNGDWEKFKKTKGSELKNIELRIEDETESEEYIKISISSRGFLFCKSSISDEKCLQITKLIIKYIGDCITIDEKDNNVQQMIEDDQITFELQKLTL